MYSNSRVLLLRGPGTWNWKKLSERPCGKMRFSCPVSRKPLPTQTQKHLLVVLRHCPPDEPWKGRRTFDVRPSINMMWREAIQSNLHVLSTEKTIKSHRAVPKVLSECVCHGSLPMFWSVGEKNRAFMRYPLSPVESSKTWFCLITWSGQLRGGITHS